MSAILELPSTLLLVFAVVGLAGCLLGVGLAVSVLHNAVFEWLQERHERQHTQRLVTRVSGGMVWTSGGWSESPRRPRAPDPDVKALIIERLKDPRRRRGLR